MSRWLTLFFLIITIPVARSQTGDQLTTYAITAVPDSLKKDANTLYQLDEAVLEVQSPARYTYTVHQVKTLLNKDAAHHLQQSFIFSKASRPERVEIHVYNALGIEIKKYREKDFEITDYDDHMTMISDAKIMRLDIPAVSWPCTLDITYQTKAGSYIDLPDWRIGGPGEAVQLCRYTVKIPVTQDIRYRTRRMALQPTVTTTGPWKTYTWEVRNVAARNAEDNSYQPGYYFPVIEVVPTVFEYDGNRGRFTNWQEFGEWNYKLYQETTPFTVQREAELKAMVAACKTDYEKIDVLYRHLKKNMRYVGIQLGIGGFKPFAVSFVEENKYGDCKALTNYMRYMLKAVGINAYPALVNTGFNSPPADPAFPSDPFNHVILCVPLAKDTVWLECTSKNNATGVLGSFTENKQALLLTEKGGILVPTPASRSSENVLNTKTIVELNAEGGSKVTASLFCTGDFRDTYYELMQQEEQEQKRIFIQYLDYKAPDNFSFTHLGDSAAGNRFNLQLAYEQLYDFKAGNKFFFRPRVNRICDEDIPVYAGRQCDYLFRFPYQKTDTTVYMLPAGWEAGSLPAPRTISSTFGTFETAVTKSPDGHSVTVTARLVLQQAVIPPAQYLDMADFFRQVNKLESEKVVFLQP